MESFSTFCVWIFIANVQKYNSFLYLDLVSCNFIELIYQLYLCIVFFKVLYCQIMSSVNIDTFNFLLLIQRLFIFYFICLIVLAKTFSRILKRNGESRHPHLVSDITRKAFSPYDMSCGFFIDALQWVKLSFISSLPNIFTNKGCCIWSTAFFCICWDNHVGSFFILLILCITLIDFVRSTNLAFLG